MLLGPKRFVHSKGPKIVLCLCLTWLSLDTERWMCNIPYRGWAMFNRNKVQFQFSTLLSNNFAPYIQNLETYFAILVYFNFGYVWVSLSDGIWNSTLYNWRAFYLHCLQVVKIKIDQNCKTHLQVRCKKLDENIETRKKNFVLSRWM